MTGPARPTINDAWRIAADGDSPAALLIRHSVLFCDHCKVTRLPRRADWLARKENNDPALSPTKAFVVVYPTKYRAFAETAAGAAVERFVGALKRLGLWRDRWMVIADSDTWMRDINAERSRLGFDPIAPFSAGGDV